ncbi:hypothetical protein NJI34_20985 [Pseudomonas sp. S 311-6]|nr:hypothetical protein CBF45_12615 [Bordetella sp. J329]MCO7639241.1 hypothetical protein [Pseudomonas sp. S 311-6]
MTLTTEMIRAGQDTAPQLSAVEIAAVWRAMCAVAPVAAQAQPTIKESLTVEQPVSGADVLPVSPTRGMNLGQRIAHVGGRENAQGYIEFGSPMAVDALIQQILRDMTVSTPQGAFQARYRAPGGEWSSWGAVTCGVKGYEQELRYLETEAQPQTSGNAQDAGELPDERAAFEQWVSQHDTESNEYQDMGADEYFMAGYRAALAAQAETPVDDKAHPRFQSGYRAGLKDHLLNAKTDDSLGGLLAAIRAYGSWKYAEAKGRTEPDLSDVRAAWDEVYEKVQTLAALAQQASGQAMPDPEIVRLAWQGKDLHSEDQPEYIVCAELVRIAEAARAAGSE